jgi:hypothetical protein
MVPPDNILVFLSRSVSFGGVSRRIDMPQEVARSRSFAIDAGVVLTAESVMGDQQGHRLLIFGVAAAMMINWGDDDLTKEERVSAVWKPPNTPVIGRNNPCRTAHSGASSGPARAFLGRRRNRQHSIHDRHQRYQRHPRSRTAARIGIRPSAREFTGCSDAADGRARASRPSSFAS